MWHCSVSVMSIACQSIPCIYFQVQFISHFSASSPMKMNMAAVGLHTYCVCAQGLRSLEQALCTFAVHVNASKNTLPRCGE